jgi:dolichol-phosphate mannosyltransferase
MTMPPGGLSIVIPCFNEEGALERVVRDIARAAEERDGNFEILIVDDGSRDRSPAIADALEREVPRVRVLRHSKNRGFGAAFTTGVGAAHGDLITLIPADGQFPANDLGRLLARAEADVVVGYRIDRKDPVRRRITTTLFYFVMFFVFGIGLRDINWIKLYRRRVLETVRPSFSGIGIDAELMVGARRRGFRFAQTRVGYLARTTGRSTGDDPRRIAQTLLELLRLGFRP